MGRPKDPKRVEARRAEVADATLRSIAKHGLEGASLRTIACEAGFTTGTLAYYFRNKKEILLFAGHTVMRQVITRIAEHLAVCPSLESLERALLAELPIAEDKRLGWQVWLTFTAQVPSDNDFRKEHEERYAELRSVVRHCFEVEAKAGNLAKGVEGILEVDRILGLFDGLGLHALLEPRLYPPAHQRQLVQLAIRKLSTQQRNNTGASQ